jgi:hypothetical protein
LPVIAIVGATGRRPSWPPRVLKGKSSTPQQHNHQAAKKKGDRRSPLHRNVVP